MIRLVKNKLKRYFINNLSIPYITKSLERLKDLGYTPNTIYDIGAYQGDFAKLCLQIWPAANVVCFEPIKDQIIQLEDWAREEDRIKVIHGLLGEENKANVKFNEGKTASSVLDEHGSHNFKEVHYTMRTLDSCIEKFDLSVPSLVKIDTQGYEYQILQGFTKNLKYADIIIAELNHIDIHKNVKMAEEVIQLLYRNDFVIYDIVEIHRRPFDKALWQTDFMFVKRNSFLRDNKQWQ